MPAMRLTLQYIRSINRQHDVGQIDARSPAGLFSKPFNIFLDFMYGAACYRQWGRHEHFGQVLKKNSDGDFRYVNVCRPLPPDEGSDGPDDPTFSPNSPSSSRDTKGTKRRKGERDMVSEEMINSMDALVALSHFLTGITPQEAASERQRREEEELLLQQRASAQKASRWAEEMFDNSS